MYFSSEINQLLQSIVDFVFFCLSFIFYCLSPIAKLIAAVYFNSIGVEINGENDCSIQVRDDRFYALVAAKGLTGFFDAFIEGYIDCDNLEEVLMKIVTAHPILFHVERYHPYRLLKYFVHTYFDTLKPKSVRNATNEHYEHHSNGIFEIFGYTNQYSTMLLYDLKQIESATLEQVQEYMEQGTLRAREQIAQKLRLEPGMKVLDIGCGFGGLAKHLAEKYKVEVTGVTICKAMAEHAKKVCEGLPVEIIYNDYRAIIGKFDRVVSIEMFEHVGETHHREYFEKVSSLLTDDGIFVFQAHHVNHDYLVSYTPLFEKSLEMYVYFPRLEEIVAKSRGSLIVEHIENLSYCFGVTSKALINVMNAKKSFIIQKESENEFRRLYIYACLSVAGGLSGKDRVYQIVFSKNALRYAYQC